MPFVTRARYERDVVILVRTINRLIRDLEAAGAGLEPSLRLIPGGRGYTPGITHPEPGGRDVPNRQWHCRFQDGAS
jgi:hypothetical protein